MIALKKGYESWVLVLRVSKINICLKFYRNNAPTKWLKDNLTTISSPETHRWKLIPRHEYRILQELFELRVTPKPLFYSYNFLITAYGGEPLSNISNLDHEFLNREGVRLLHGLKFAGISHNDIKISNILFNKEQLVLIDFTFSDTPHVRLSSCQPNPSWGRFGEDFQLSDLAGLVQKSEVE